MSRPTSLEAPKPPCILLSRQRGQGLRATHISFKQQEHLKSLFSRICTIADDLDASFYIPHGGAAVTHDLVVVPPRCGMFRGGGGHCKAAQDPALG